ncbi:MAG: VIT1/CCC1 transporter family protein [Isosphaeraceae bacterium]
MKGDGWPRLRSSARRLRRGLLYVWAAPTTSVGLFAGVLTLASGGSVQRRRGALEFHGGFARWMLERTVVSASAMTLGHVIIGRDPACLDACRDHEQVHVRQVEVLGMFFIPAYVLASVWAASRGGHYYLDNWFEVDARAKSEPELWALLQPPARPGPGRDRPARSSAMPQTRHVEKHFTASDRVRDIVIGMSDGLTVPFALAAGLSGNAAIATSVIVTAGLAEIAAGSIAMGLGGYLAARSDAEHYQSERKREEDEVKRVPNLERNEVAEIFRAYGLSDAHIGPVLDAFEANPKAWVDFMMQYELGLDEPDPKRALGSAGTIAGSYAIGGLIPLAPYMLVANQTTALTCSVVVTLLALTVFGYVKGTFTGAPPLRSAWQTALIGGLAAGAAFLIARVFS